MTSPRARERRRRFDEHPSLALRGWSNHCFRWRSRPFVIMKRRNHRPSASSATRGRSCPCAEPCSLLLLCASAGWAAPAELRTLKQETITGELVGISAKEIVITAGVRQGDDADRSGADADVRPAGRRPAQQPAVGGRGADRRHRAALRQVLHRQEQVTRDAAGRPDGEVPAVGACRRCWPTPIWRRTARRGPTCWTRPRATTTWLAKVKHAGPNAVEGLIGDADEAGETIHFTLPSGKEGNFALANIYGMAFSRKPTPNAAPVQCRLFGHATTTSSW